ncbi:ATP-grasp domain-containing protein [Flavitalea sp. BT771]|uniref:ATP-grasp domain-containing protein n=1 Tax=Flavitalea sp. BT771 TaxID=3063329 RepID=UPI0026E2223C|nr:ATP-grasp domain-containing protein [Flavitalea sp. BT771]MDO6429647.1 ATP-grasp domain-containing protein [Flavitalea sp. BT771]MDV6218225.1 ATP-grasp domain-containing protein [Flavitalea sp. BT771]
MIGLSSVQWVVQKNLTNSNDFSALEKACRELKISFVGIDVIPFSNELPDFDWKPKNIFYGSTTFNNLAYSNKELSAGVFFNPTTFSIERYIKEWGQYMLNYGAIVTTFEELAQTEYDPERMLFIRPDDDGKSFAGEVLRFDEYHEWFERLKMIENAGISGKTRIIVGEPFHIGREWRLWCVDKKVIAATLYRNKFKLEKLRGCPNEVISFAEARCLQFAPHDVFVMDVCETGGDLYIVECNCMNAAGFYHADIEAIVSNITNYLLDQTD